MVPARSMPRLGGTINETLQRVHTMTEADLTALPRETPDGGRTARDELVEEAMAKHGLTREKAEEIITAFGG